MLILFIFFFFFQAEDGIRDSSVTGVQTCALPIFGVGQSVSTLLHDHASLERTLVQVPVYLMGDEDSSDIIHKTESLLAQSGFDNKFSENAIKRTVEASGGFPWFVHTIAQEALKIAYGDS